MKRKMDLLLHLIVTNLLHHNDILTKNQWKEMKKDK
jgi:hypothetical protein